MKELKLFCILVISFICMSVSAQESGGGGAQVVTQEKKGITGTSQFHPRGFYMHFGYVFDRGNASGTYRAPYGSYGDQNYSYAYHAHGVSFDFGGKIFSKKKLGNPFQVGGDLSSTAQFCVVTLFTNTLSDPYIMFWGVKGGPSFAWNFNNKRFIYITPMVGVDYFGLTIAPTYNDQSGYPWDVSKYTWDAAFGIAAGVKVEYVIKRFSIGTSCFYNPTFVYDQKNDIISRIQYSAFLGFKLSNPRQQ